MSIHAVLLVPEDGDPHGLLEVGPCGVRPPMAYLRSCCNGHPGPWVTEGTPPSCCDVPGCGSPRLRRIHAIRGPHALVLAWGGEGVVAGMDLFRRAQGYPPSLHYEPEISGEALALCADDPTLGRVVLLDADGQEVKP